MIDYIVKRNFPLPRIQTGAVLGNSYLGVMVWGGDDTVNISLGCSAMWDHRGGMPWSEKQNYKDIHTALLNEDLETIRKMFQTSTQFEPGQPSRPSLVPLGRVVLKLKANCRLKRFERSVADGLL